VRRGDLIPLGLLAALAGTVGIMTLRAPRVDRGPVTSAEIATAPVDTATEAALRHDAPGTRRTASSGDFASETRRSRLAPPAFDAADVRRRLGYGASGTYIMAMVDKDSGAARWPDRPLEPIRVWVEPVSSVAGWKPEYVDLARAAFERWRAAGIPVRISFLVDSAGAEVRVLWTDRFPDARIGSTHRVRDQHWWLVGGEITLALSTSSGDLLPPEIVAATAIHEAGHLLGLGHSPGQQDLMASHHNGVYEPSAADLATIRLLYTIPPGRLR
jgi:hypothetical protein